MPVLDGFEVIARIRALERQRGGRIPVIALTARSRNEDRERCLAAGMDEFLAKPIHAEALWATIDRVASGARVLIDADALLAACARRSAASSSACAPRSSTRSRSNCAPPNAGWRRETRARCASAAHRLHGMARRGVVRRRRAVASELEDEADGALDAARPLLARLSRHDPAARDRARRARQSRNSGTARTQPTVTNRWPLTRAREPRSTARDLVWRLHRLASRWPICCSSTTMRSSCRRQVLGAFPRTRVRVEVARVRRDGARARATAPTRRGAARRSVSRTRRRRGVRGDPGDRCPHPRHLHHDRASETRTPRSRRMKHGAFDYLSQATRSRAAARQSSARRIEV